MKPTIRRKDKTALGEVRYVLEWTENGEIKTFSLNPNKLLDLIQKSKTKQNLKVK